MRYSQIINEGIEEMGGTTVSLDPSPRQLAGLCSRFSQHGILRGWFFNTKTDPKTRMIVWGGEKQVHFLMARAVEAAGFDCDLSAPLIIGTTLDATLQACDWDDWQVHQSGSLFYVRDSFVKAAHFDPDFARYFPASSEPLDVEYNDDGEWVIYDEEPTPLNEGLHHLGPCGFQVS